MNISIFGLGYVGCVSAGCLTHQKHVVVGVDIDPDKVALINAGRATIIEDGLEQLITEGVKNNLLKATTNVEEAVLQSEIGIICVGTPSMKNGHLDMTHIYAIINDIGVALKSKNDFFTITIRSTVMPGTNKKVSEIIANVSGKKIDGEFAVVSNPEFLREGNAVEDFFNPPYTVVGSKSEKGIEKVRQLFAFLSAPILIVDIKIAEMIKFVNNSFHALKVAFANEIGRVCKVLDINSHELMELFIRDTQLNISSKYFKPGSSYGGSCLPKDLKALNTLAYDKYLNIPILESIHRSNNFHNEFILQLVLSKNVKKVGVFGLSFKKNTDDLRFSPSIELCERLIGKGINVSVYDENISLSRLVGKNKRFLMEHLPHIEKLLQEDLSQFLQENNMLIIMHKNVKLISLKNMIKESTFVIDVAKIDELSSMNNYNGICW